MRGGFLAELSTGSDVAAVSEVLVFFEHPHATTLQVAVGGAPLVVGRVNGEADITLDDGRVSRRHGRLWRDGDTVWYEDLGSSNGSWRDGVRLTEPVCVEASRPIVVGETTLRRMGEDDASAAPDDAAKWPLDMRLRVHAPAATASIADAFSAVQPALYTAALYRFIQAMLTRRADELVGYAISLLCGALPSHTRATMVSWPPGDDGRLRPWDNSAGGSPPPVSVQLATRAVQRGEAMLIEHLSAQDAAVQTSAIRHGIGSAIYAPLMAADGDVLGIFCVDAPLDGGGRARLTPDDFEFVRAIGGLLSAALEADRTRARQQRIELQARELAARRDTMRMFLQVASHDLKNPLTAILLSARAMESNLDARTISLLTSTILEAGQRALDLIESYLEMGVLDEGRTLKLTRTDVELAPLIEGEIALVRATLDAHDQEVYTFSCDVGGSRCNADAGRLRQIVANLLSNAVKYSPEGGHISVVTESTAEGVVFRVSDEGVGIAAEDQLRLFRQFERVGSNSASGLGLGLWLSAALVAAHGGRIGVESAPHRGSTFWFLIPPPRR